MSKSNSNNNSKLPKLPPLILLSGRLGSGKTKLANRLVQIHNYQVDALADVIRRDVCEILGVTLDNLKNKPDLKSMARPVLQAVGEFKRNTVSPKYWADRLVEHMQDQDMQMEHPWPWVIDDMRFPHELEVFQERYATKGYKHIHLYSTENDAVKYLMEVRGVAREMAIHQANDISEQYQDEMLDMCDLSINVSRTLDDSALLHAPQKVVDGFALETMLDYLEKERDSDEQTTE